MKKYKRIYWKKINKDLYYLMYLKPHYRELLSNVEVSLGLSIQCTGIDFIATSSGDWQGIQVKRQQYTIDRFKKIVIKEFWKHLKKEQQRLSQIQYLVEKLM